MVFWQRTHEGEIWVSHKASPGLTEQQARAFGYEPSQCREGKVFEAAILTCSHCDVRVIRNPLRERERATCLHCSNHYICDSCDWKRRQPDYIHRPFQAVKDLVLEGKPWQSALFKPQSPTRLQLLSDQPQPPASTWPS